MTIEIQDRGRLRYRLLKMLEGIPIDARKIVHETAERIRDDAREFVAKDTRSLEKSIRTQTIVSKKLATSIGVTAGGYIVNPKTGRLVDYAIHQEYGTSKMTGKPYMRPAIIKNTVGFFLAFIEALKERSRA